MDADEALDMAETWTALPDANGAAHALAAEVRRLREELEAEQHEMTCPNCEATIRSRLADRP